MGGYLTISCLKINATCYKGKYHVTDIRTNEHVSDVVPRELFLKAAHGVLEERTIEGLKVISPESLLNVKTSTVERIGSGAETGIESMIKAAKDVEFETGGVVKASDILQRTYKEGTPQAYLHYAGLGDAPEPSFMDLLSGKAKVGGRGRPTININPALKVSKFPKEILEKPITAQERASIEADFKKLREGKFPEMKEIGKNTFAKIEEGLRKRATIDQWALYKRLTQYMEEHPATYSGVGALSGIRGEYELLQSVGVRNIAETLSLRGKVGKYLGFGEKSIDIGGTRFEVQRFKTEVPKSKEPEFLKTTPISEGKEVDIGGGRTIKLRPRPESEKITRIEPPSNYPFDFGGEHGITRPSAMPYGVGVVAVSTVSTLEAKQPQQTPDWMKLGSKVEEERVPIYRTSRLYKGAAETGLKLSRKIPEASKVSERPPTSRVSVGNVPSFLSSNMVLESPVKIVSLKEPIPSGRKSVVGEPSVVSQKKPVSKTSSFVDSVVSLPSTISRDASSLVSTEPSGTSSPISPAPSKVSTTSSKSGVSYPSPWLDFYRLSSPVNEERSTDVVYYFDKSGEKAEVKKPKKKLKEIIRYRPRTSPIFGGVEKLFENPLEAKKVKTTRPKRSKAELSGKEFDIGLDIIPKETKKVNKGKPKKEFWEM